MEKEFNFTGICIPEKHKHGLKQLDDYLKRQTMSKGFLVIFDFNKEMNDKTEKSVINGRDIFMMWV